jgi:hypothetical protein
MSAQGDGAVPFHLQVAPSVYKPHYACRPPLLHEAQEEPPSHLWVVPAREAPPLPGCEHAGGT